jgi:hypothetical protein
MKTIIRNALLSLFVLSPLVAPPTVLADETVTPAGQDYAMPAPDKSGLLVGTFSHAYPSETFQRPYAVRVQIQKHLAFGYVELSTFLGGVDIPADEVPSLKKEGQTLTQSFLGYALPPGKYSLLGLKGSVTETCKTFLSGRPMQVGKVMEARLEAPMEFEIRSGEITYLGQLHMDILLGDQQPTCIGNSGGLIGAGLSGYISPAVRPQQLTRPADLKRMQERYPNVPPETPGYPSIKPAQ